MNRSTAAVASLLCFSGLSALIYQTVWLREFRLIFGASTSATAAVLAIFMAGLGAGSAVLGKRADLRERPLVFYGNLELLIAASAALSLPLLWLVREAYFATGGSVRMGTVAASIVRLVLSALVLAIPTFLMGGTLPAAARAVETRDDHARRNLALLYGTNTLGAVVGTLVSTFFMLEALGNRQTLLVAALLNALVGMAARSLGRNHTVERSEKESGEGAPAHLPARIVLAAAAVFGFAFLLMELVWYRMLGPLLGGTTFMFGLILAVALLGIGAGGIFYSMWNRASVSALAVTSALEALAIIAPFVLGDRLAHYANLLRALGSMGFQGHVVSWSALTIIVVLPAALISGFQFPLLIALLGRGRDDVGRDVGLAYAWNTFGAIAGSLAGGFGLLPLLSAPGAWRLSAIVLAVIGAITAAYAIRRRERLSYAAVAIAILATAGTFATGPTAAWRHSGIGAGRLQAPLSLNDTRADENRCRRQLAWEADGRESSVAILRADDISFVVNGKADGSARGDAGTQVMGGMIGALLHDDPRSSLVIGLGTGSTAGWLASVPSMQRVDVVELEPVVLRVARDCAQVNRDVMRNPKVHVSIADAREVLLASRSTYDIIFSEPSNPYRAGIASLFTREFYRATSNRLAPGGIFLQWVQAYDIDAATLRTIYATIGGVFPHVDTFATTPGDLVLVATTTARTYDIERIRARLSGGVFHEAISPTWRVQTAEGFLSHFMANGKVARALASRASDLNTDDRPVIEFGFARGVDTKQLVVTPLAEFATAIGGTRPESTRGAVDWNAVDLNRAGVSHMTAVTPEGAAHREFLALCLRDLNAAGEYWMSHGLKPVNSAELASAAEALADRGPGQAAMYAQALSHFQPVEADAIMARLMMRQQKREQATSLLVRAFTRYRRDPWPNAEIMRHALEMAIAIVREDHRAATPFFDALSVPFAAFQLEEGRKTTLLTMASSTENCGPRTIAALRAFEPHPPWGKELLTLRAVCYARAGLRDLAGKADRDYAKFMLAEPEPLVISK